MTAPLLAPVANPAPSLDQLTALARQRGLGDAERLVFDGWSFGTDRDLPSDLLDPPYVRWLREQRRATVSSLLHDQELTQARVGDVQVRIEELDASLLHSRERISQLASLDAQRSARSLARFVNSRRGTGMAHQAISPTNPVWEGLTIPLRWYYQLLVMAFLVGVVFWVHLFVFTRLATAVSAAAPDGLAIGVAAVMALICEMGLYLSGLLFRHRQATGQSMLLTVLSLGLLAPAAVMLSIVAYLAGRMLSLDLTPADADAFGVSPITAVVVFAMVLLMAFAMAYMLGLARPHPAQQAYIRLLDEREAAYLERARRGEAINPRYLAPPPPPRQRRDNDPDAPEPQAPPNRLAEAERAIIHAYHAAEEAYFDGLITGMADPTFTEAVVRRRGLRREESDQPDITADPGDPATPSAQADEDSLDDADEIGGLQR